MNKQGAARTFHRVQLSVDESLPVASVVVCTLHYGQYDDKTPKLNPPRRNP